MDRHRHTGMEAHFSGTTTTILADTQHALILNYADTKPCSARESLPYRQEQHPRLSSRRTFVGDYPRYRDLSTLLPLDHPRKGVKRPFRPFPSLFRTFVSLFRLLSYSESSLWSVFFSVALVDPSPLVDGKKRIPLFSKDRPCLRFLPLRVRQKILPPRKMFHRNWSGSIFINLVFNPLTYREGFIQEEKKQGEDG